ncbi:hypothetical protein [Methylibium rhizosphaerae]|uniref:hypothetical protein n=1 Tax=Methylibium rhizosphaerae TaxID=2570323 RepID=UPI00112C1DB7|nr:hypothetical protein [Methylibium rhizosphaerae]
MKARLTLFNEPLLADVWRPLSDDEVHAWVRHAPGAPPEARLYTFSPCGVPVVCLKERMEAAIAVLAQAQALDALAAVLSTASSSRLHIAALVDACVATGDRDRLLRTLESADPAGRDYVLATWPAPAYREVWEWARCIARTVEARIAANAATAEAADPADRRDQ